LRLNAQQKQAVDTTEGPLLVLAGAGTGKTSVITKRIAHLMDKGVRPERILAVTFTNKAAGEMKERVAKLVGKKKAGELTVGTFHAFCVRALRAHGERIGLPGRFSICDGSDQIAALKGALRDLHVSEKQVHPRALQAQISLAKNRMETLEHDDLLHHAMRRYQEHLRRAHMLDFDDLLVEMLRLLKEDTETRVLFRERYHYLLVDEYQDTNGPQYEIVRQIAGQRRNLCVVSDDDQSIYGWRGADVRKILKFERDFPGARVIRLETNYRSTQPILDAANAVIRHNPSRHEKTLRSARGPGSEVKIVEVEDEETEARGVVGDIMKRVRLEGARYKDCAVLFRTATQPRPFEQVLRSRNVPYVLIGGQSFFDRKEVRDVLAYVRLVANPLDEVSLLRVINCPPRGIGKRSIDAALQHATERGISVNRALEEIDAIEGMSATARAAAKELMATVQRYHAEEPGRDLPGFLQRLVHAVGYRAEVERCYADQLTRNQRWAGVEELYNFAENFVRRNADATRAEFLESLALRAQDDQEEVDSGRDAVTLMTLHAAKGLEFPRVYLVGAEEGILPHERSVAEDTVEEERRLMYVGITRAQLCLTVTHARSRARYGRRAEGHLSRFVYEMRGETPPKNWRAAGSKASACSR